MIDSGVTLIARRMAVEYGDGECILEFWRDSLHVYNKLGKVRVSHKSLVTKTVHSIMQCALQCTLQLNLNRALCKIQSAQCFPVQLPYPSGEEDCRVLRRVRFPCEDRRHLQRVRE